MILIFQVACYGMLGTLVALSFLAMAAFVFLGATWIVMKSAGADVPGFSGRPAPADGSWREAVGALGWLVAAALTYVGRMDPPRRLSVWTEVRFPGIHALFFGPPGDRAV